MSNKQAWWCAAVAVGLAVWPLGVQAAEHGGGDMHEHGGSTMEHGGSPMSASDEAPTADAASSAPVEAATPEPATAAAPAAEPSAEQIRQAIRDDIAQTVVDEGAFIIEDEQTGAMRNLELVQVHERVGKTGSAYYSCTDMKDTATGETLDLDFDVQQEAGELIVTDVRIHKVNGQERYTYDANDNRIPATSGN